MLLRNTARALRYAFNCETSKAVKCSDSVSGASLAITVNSNPISFSNRCRRGDTEARMMGGKLVALMALCRSMV